MSELIDQFNQRLRDGRLFGRMPNAFCVSFAFPESGLQLEDQLNAAVDALTSRLLATTGDAPLEVLVNEGGKPRPANEAYLRRLLGRYTRGRIDHLSLRSYPTAELSLMNPRVRFPVPQWEEIRLRVSLDHWSTALDPGDWVDVLLTCGDLLGPGYGFFTHDTIPEKMTPYEAATRWGALHDEYLSQYVRGYYWANLLSPSHVETLGGVTAVREAPFCTVQERPGGMIYIQATRTLASFGDTELYAIREYLRPVLHPGHRARPEHQRSGASFRVIYDST